MNFIKKTILALAAVFSAQTMSAQPYMSERLSMEGVDIISSVYYLKVNAYDAVNPVITLSSTTTSIRDSRPLH